MTATHYRPYAGESCQYKQRPAEVRASYYREGAGFQVVGRYLDVEKSINGSGHFIAPWGECTQIENKEAEA